MSKTTRIVKHKTLLSKIHKKLVEDGTNINKDQVEDLLKNNAGLNISCRLMDLEELANLIEAGELMAVQIGLKTK